MAKTIKTKTEEFGGLTLELRLDGVAVFNIEKRLNESLMGLFMNGEGGMKLPPVNKLLVVLHQANQKHNVTEKMLVNAYSKYLEEGNTTMDIMNIVQELLEDAGFFGGKEEKETEETVEAPIALTGPAEESMLL